MDLLTYSTSKMSARFRNDPHDLKSHTHISLTRSSRFAMPLLFFTEEEAYCQMCGGMVSCVRS